MNEEKKGKKFCRIYLPCDVYTELARFARERYGGRSFTVTAAEVVRAGLAALRAGADTTYVVQGGGVTTAHPSDLERRLKELEEHYIELTKTVAALEGEVAALKERLPAVAPQLPAAAAETTAVVQEAQRERAAPERRRGRGALDILKERGFEKEEELAKKVKNARAVLARLAEEGAIMIQAPRGFIAVHPELWEQLRRDLELCKPTDLTPLEGKVRELYLLLARSGLVSYSAEKGWQLPEALSGDRAVAALGAAPEPTYVEQEKGKESGSGGSGTATFVFKCPQCGAELHGGSPEETADEASKHVWKEHGILIATDALYRYITRIS
ncbi:MAG: hypothetical protein QXT28_10000 [Thermofilaceae archaeon]